MSVAWVKMTALEGEGNTWTQDWGAERMRVKGRVPADARGEG